MGNINCPYTDTLCHFIDGRKDNAIVQIWSSETTETGYMVCVEMSSLHTSQVQSPGIASLSSVQWLGVLHHVQHRIYQETYILSVIIAKY